MSAVCRDEYVREGGRQRGDRIVRCHLQAGHPGEHEEAETEVTWPQRATDAVSALEVQLDRALARVRGLEQILVAAAPAADTAHRQLRAIREARTHHCDQHCTEGGCDFDLGGFVDRVDEILGAAEREP